MAYEDDDDDGTDADSLGIAAALQALKLFNQGETGSSQGRGTYLGLAMSEASKVCRSAPILRIWAFATRRYQL